MGKEAADHKIREYLKLYAAHRQCSTIFLGASHDNSYAAVISSVETTAGLSKLVLLQGYSNIAQSLKQYKTRFATIPDLFRTSPVVINDKNTLPGVPALTTPKSPAAKRRSLPPPSKETSKEKEVDSDKGGKTKSTAKDKFAPKDTKEKSSKKVAPTATPKGKPPPLPKRPIKATDDVWFPPDELGDDSDEDSDGFGFGSDAHSGSLFGSESDHESTSGWSVRRGKSFAQSFARPRSNSNAAANASSTKKKPLKKNKPAARAGSVATVRNLKPRPCHTFYLSPWGCKNGKACEYSHEYNLDDEQREELSRLAKEIICPYVRSKRCHFSEDECVYG
jgi:hypothetical protein